MLPHTQGFCILTQAFHRREDIVDRELQSVQGGISHYPWPAARTISLPSGAAWMALAHPELLHLARGPEGRLCMFDFLELFTHLSLTSLLLVRLGEITFEHFTLTDLFSPAFSF